MEEKLKGLLYNEEYVKELHELREPKKISESLSEHGVDLDEQTVEKTIELLKKKTSGELSDKELSDVAGGFDPMAIGVIVMILSLLGTGAGVGISNSC